MSVALRGDSLELVVRSLDGFKMFQVPRVRRWWRDTPVDWNWHVAATCANIQPLLTISQSQPSSLFQFKPSLAMISKDASQKTCDMPWLICTKRYLPTSIANHPLITTHRESFTNTLANQYLKAYSTMVWMFSRLLAMSIGKHISLINFMISTAVNIMHNHHPESPIIVD